MQEGVQEGWVCGRVCVRVCGWVRVCVCKGGEGGCVSVCVCVWEGVSV